MWQDFEQQDVKTADLFGSAVFSVSNEHLEYTVTRTGNRYQHYSNTNDHIYSFWF